MSLGSIMAAASLIPIYFLFHNVAEELELFILISVVVIFIIFKHRSNIQRIRSNEEPKITALTKTKKEGNR